MTVSILRPLEYADAGRVRMLHIGEAHDLPERVASELIAVGAAVLCEPAVRHVAAVVPPENGRRRRK